jgi:hypothetical protein
VSRAFAIKRRKREGERGEKGMMRSRGYSFGVENESNSSFSLLQCTRMKQTQPRLSSDRLDKRAKLYLENESKKETRDDSEQKHIQP